MLKNSCSNLSVPGEPMDCDEILYYPRKKDSTVKQKRPPQLVRKKRARTLFSPSILKVAQPVTCNIGANLSSLYDKLNPISYFDQCFEKICKLGEGSFGEVFKVCSKDDGKCYAVKVISNINRKDEVINYEKIPCHKNCVELKQAWEQEGKLFIQMELCATSLEMYTEVNHEIPENRIWEILMDVLLGVKNLHDNNFIHLDIKPANILLSDDNTCKLADFGLLFNLDDKSNRDRTEGDSRYMAPELFSNTYTTAADIFSIGITILELASDLALPQNGVLWHHLRRGKIPSEIKTLSTELGSVIEWMMSPDHRLRPTVSEILKSTKLCEMMEVSSFQYENTIQNVQAQMELIIYPPPQADENHITSTPMKCASVSLFLKDAADNVSEERVRHVHTSSSSNMLLNVPELKARSRFVRRLNLDEFSDDGCI